MHAACGMHAAAPSSMHSCPYEPWNSLWGQEQVPYRRSVGAPQDRYLHGRYRGQRISRRLNERLTSSFRALFGAPHSPRIAPHISARPRACSPDGPTMARRPRQPPQHRSCGAERCICYRPCMGANAIDCAYIWRGDTVPALRIFWFQMHKVGGVGSYFVWTRTRRP